MRNEADRYLTECLKELVDLVDQLFIYDDRSNDESVRIASRFTNHVAIRDASDPSFSDHEGQFRQNAWAELVRQLEPTIEDWVLSVDADEFVVAEGDTRGQIQAAVVAAVGQECCSISLPIPEVWHQDHRTLCVRTDGFWGGLRGKRLFRFQPDGEFPDCIMGCGSAPTYVADGRFLLDNYGLSILHLGYARAADRQSKFQRYMAAPNSGHNPRHIASILEEPTLERWCGPVPYFLP